MCWKNKNKKIATTATSHVSPCWIFPLRVSSDPLQSLLLLLFFIRPTFFFFLFFVRGTGEGSGEDGGQGFWGLGGIFVFNFSLCVLGFFDMSEVLADAKGQTNALVSKKSESKFEAWMISDGKGVCQKCVSQ